jgi:hypothetical protein
VFSKLSHGDLIGFSGFYVLETDNGPRITMDAIRRHGIVIEIMNNGRGIKVFSKNEVCILTEPSDSRGSIEFQILNKGASNAAEK